MKSAMIIDGNKLKAEEMDKLKGALEARSAAGHRKPRLDFICVGQDESIYARLITKDAAAIGMDVNINSFTTNTIEAEIINKIEELDVDPAVDAISLLVPLSWPGEEALRLCVVANKDCDGAGPASIQQLCTSGDATFVDPATAASLLMIQSTGVDVTKGRNLVLYTERTKKYGIPMILKLLGQGETAALDVGCVSVEQLTSSIRSADVLISNAKVAGLIRGDMVKPGSCVIDVGLNYDGGPVKGDVNFEEVKEVAGFLTPTPGGVGPVLRAMLLKNVLKAAQMANP